MRKIAWQIGGFLLLLFLPLLIAGFVWSNPYYVGVSLLWFIFCGWLIYRWIKAPLDELLIYMDNLRQGIPLRTRLTRKDDIYGQLAKQIEKFERIHTSDLSALHGRMEEIQAILTSMSEGVIATEITGRISLINPAAAELFHLSPGEGVGEFPHKVFPQSELADIFHQIYVKGNSIQQEIIWPGNPERVLNLNLAPIRDEINEEIRGVVAVIGDVTQLRKLESMRRDFVANVSHELKTPLTSIKGFIETLLDGALEERETAMKFLTIIYQETERLNNLIHDLLDISKLESGQGEVKQEPVRLDQLIGEIALTLHNRIQEKNIELTQDLKATLMIGDEDLLREVFLNLLDNAIKYSPPGSKVSVESEIVGDDILIRVKDTGFGIPEESLPRIFERFYRVDKGRSREMGGTGLGLSIVKHIIERHNGKVTVESELGRGSQFTVIIPYKNEDSLSSDENHELSVKPEASQSEIE